MAGQLFGPKSKIVFLSPAKGEMVDHKFSLSLHESDFLKPKKTTITSLKSSKTRISELLSEILMKNGSFSSRMFSFLNHFAFFHALALSLNIFILFISVYFGNSCNFTPQNKSIKYDFGRIFSLIVYDITIWSIQFLALYHVLFCFKEMNTKCCFIYSIQFFYFFAFILILLLPSLINEGFFLLKNSSNLIYFGAIFFVTVCYSYYLFRLKFQFKHWIKNICKTGSIFLTLSSNLFFCISIFRPLYAYIDQNLSQWSDNINKIILTVHSSLFGWALKKFLFYYYQTLLNEKLDKEKLYLKMFIMIRFCCCFMVSLHLVGVAKMKLGEWGGWILIFNYVLFILKSYTWIDLKKIFLAKFFSAFIRRKKASIKNDQSLKNFQKMFSGAFIDVQLISCCRFVIIYVFKRWTLETNYYFFYKTCDYQISNDFPFEFQSVMAMILTNVFALFVLLIYIKEKQKLILNYLVIYNKLLNLYVLFALHFLLEGALQMFAANLFFQG